MTLSAWVRRIVTAVLAVLWAIPLSGCLVVSLQPLVERDGVEPIPGIVGVWEPVDDDTTLVFRDGSWNAYELSMVDGDDTMRMTGRFTRLGGALVLDLTTATGVEEPPVTVQAHLILLAEVRGDTLTLRPLNYDWFSGKMAAKSTAALAPVLDGEKNVVLTAPTSALRTWLAAHVASKNAWDEATVYKRQPASRGAVAADAPPAETEAVVQGHEADDYTRYELLAPESSSFRIHYDVTATEAGATQYFNSIRKGSSASDITVIDVASGLPLPFVVVSGAAAAAAGLRVADPDTQYIKVTLPRPVPAGGETRLRIGKTYADARSYFQDESDVVFDRSLGIRRNAVVLPANHELVACNVPAQLATEADGRLRVSFVLTGPGQGSVVVRARPLPVRPTPAAATAAADARPPAAVAAARPSGSGPSMAARLDERARQDREIVYFLQQPETHAFALYHDYTERRPGEGTYLNVVRAGSRVSNPSARLLDSGEALKVETLRGDAITQAKLDIDEPVTPATEVVVIRFPPVKAGQSARLRIQETYTDPGRYYVAGDELVWDRSLGRPRNAVVLPSGWHVTASSIPAVVSMTEDGRLRLDYENPRPDDIAVLVKARRR